MTLGRVDAIIMGVILQNKIMQNLNEIHRRLEDLKKRRRELNRMFKDELEHNEEYQKIVEQLKTLRDKKKSIENVAKVAAFREMDELERVKEQIKDDTQLLTDLALNKYISGESVEIIEDETRFVPEFSVKFKKQQDSYLATAEAERAESHPERTLAPVSATA
jgi:vacuolar-type H+-ATPase subunit I/STV1